jgi:4-hydroxybenzoate polyprenyltransferase
LLFVSGITGIVGVSFAENIPVTAGVAVFLASFLSYGFGQALTDCFQIDTDALSSPYRPLTQGVITRKQVFLTSCLGLAFCVAVFAWQAPINLLLGGLAGLGLATYTPFKRRWWGGPWYNAWIVSVLCLMAYLAASGGAISSLPAGLPWMLGTVLLGYANFVLTGYFKDIAADRATGYKTIPVVFGRRTAAIVSDLFAAGAIASAALAVFTSSSIDRTPGSILIAAAFLGGGAITSLVAQIRLHTVTSDEAAHRAIAPVVHSYVLLLSGVSVLQKPVWGIPLLFFCAAYVAVLKRRPEKSQI